MNKRLSVREILGDAWDLARNNFWILIGFTAVQFLCLSLISVIASFLGAGVISVFVQQILISLFDAFFTVAFYQVFFKLLDEPGDADFPDVMPNLIKAINFLVVKLVIGIALVVIIAMISTLMFYNKEEIDTADPLDPSLYPFYFFIAIPLIFITIRLCFVQCFIVDQESGSSESISQSWTLTRGHFGLIAMLFLVMLALNILGAMAFLVGLLFTVPFSSIILIIAYRHLVNSYIDEEEILLSEPEDKNGN